MRRLLFFFIWCPVLLQAQTITFEVREGAGETVRTTKPVAGRYFWANYSIDTLNEDGTVVIENKESLPGFFDFHYKKLYRLYVRPGQSYHISIDEQGPDNAAFIEARDGEGQQLLNSFSPDFYQREADRYYKHDSVFSNIKQLVISEIDSILLPFGDLYTSGKIDKGFYDAAQYLVRNYYASVLGMTMYDPIMKTVYHPDSVGYEAGKISQLDAQWQEVLAVSDVFDEKAMISPTYLDYAEAYNSWYLFVFRYQADGRYARVREENTYWKATNDIIHENYGDPLREHLLAYQIYSTAIQDKFESHILNWHEQFLNQYPGSLYSPYLEPEVEKVVTYHEKVGGEFKAEHQFVSNYGNIDTFEELAQQFKGKTVYIDLWATWCGPCKAEFDYNHELKQFAKENGVEVLYISIDRKQADQQWKEMIKYYDLAGFHIRASDKLSAEIRQLFGQQYGEDYGISIPRYVILKDGKVVVANARRPSAKEELYAQLAEYL